MSPEKKWMRYLNPGSLYLDNPPELRGGPPFNFENVTSRVFPIKANMARLVRFCDQYLNCDDADEKTCDVEFRPALPYVYLMVINYGSMSPSSVSAQNLGWVAQREVTFTVPLEQWEKENGRMVFKNWACVSPFIFVDDELSLTTGREVYGWPKAYAQMETLPTLWSQDPRMESRLFVMKTDITSMPYAGQREQPLVLMEIDLAPRPTYSEFPPSPKNPWNPISIVTTAAEGSLRLIEDVTEVLLGLPIRGYRSDRDPATLLRMTGTLAQSFFRLLPSYLWPANTLKGLPTDKDTASECFLNQITLKQFRDAEKPNKACYQAIVSSSMGINRLNACGLLGDLYLLRGDPSGGYTIRLCRYTAQPIIETLGLEIESSEQGSRGGAIAPREFLKSTPVALIKPTFPFWTDVDLHYGKGDTLCTRSDSQPLRTHKGTPYWINTSIRQKQTNAKEKSAKTADRMDQNSPNQDRARVSKLPDYNMVQGLAVQAVSGPFRFPDVTLQVYPLLADRGRLRKYVDAYLNKPLNESPIEHSSGKAARLTFEPFGSYVYMVINVTDRQFGTMWSETNNIGWWADKDISFSVPVKVYQQNGDLPELISLAMIVPFAYANSSRGVITDREVNGRNVAKAVITCPPDAWLGPRGPASARKMLELETQVFPALNVGQKSEMRTLLELVGCDLSEDLGTTTTRGRLIGERWLARLEQEAVRISTIATSEACKNAQILALELMTRQNAFNVIYLKQYRDAVDPNSFCYQAYVNSVRTVHSVLEIQLIQDRPEIRLHKYPDHNIRDALGLECQRMDTEGDSVVFVLDPIRPFWMRLQVNEELSKVLSSRSGEDKTGAWRSDHSWFRTESPQRRDRKEEEQQPLRWDRNEQEEEPYFRAPWGRTSVGQDLLSYINEFPHPKQANEESVWDDQTKVAADSWLRRILLDHVRDIDQNPEYREELQAPDSPLSEVTRNDLVRGNWQLERLANAKSTDDLYWFVEELYYVLQGRPPDPRFTRQQARGFIEELEDVKALVELVLYEYGKATAKRQSR